MPAQSSLHAEVNFQRPSLEPTPAACGKMCRLGDLGNSKHVLVKCPGFVLTPGWHRKLNVIYVTDLHFLRSALIVCIVCSFTVRSAMSGSLMGLSRGVRIASQPPAPWSPPLAIMHPHPFDGTRLR